MKRTLAIAMAILCSFAAAKGDAPASRPSPCQKAFRKIRIDAPAEYMDAVRNTSIRSDMLNGYGVPSTAGEAESAAPVTAHRTLAGDYEVFTISVDLTPWNGQPPVESDAADLADRVVENLKSQLADATENQRDKWQDQLQSDTESIRSLKEAMGDTEDYLQENLNILLNAGRLADPSTDGLRELARTLESEHEASQIDIEGKTARQKALTEAIAKLQMDVGNRVAHDSIMRQLGEVEDVRRQEFSDAKSKQAQGLASSDDVNKAEVAWAEASTATLERREAAAKAAGADSLQQWNADLLSISVDLAELHARRDAMEKHLEVLSSALSRLEQFPSEESLKKSFDDLSGKLRNLKLDLNSVTHNLADKARPKLAVVESRDEPEKN